jgi:hypothetical protein
MLITKLILAHLLGDFILQPNAWVSAKEKKKLKAWQLYIHVIIHFIVLSTLVWQISFIKWAAVLAGVHLFTDLFKLYFQQKHTKRFWFFADQTVHIIAILAIWIIYESKVIIPIFAIHQNVWLLVTCLYALTHPVSVLIRNVISRWTPETTDDNTGSLENAGNYIGILERLFVFTFVVLGHWDSIGFLLAAKSVFRFGDLKESKDRKLTEYVLIGTLFSFGIAVLTGITYNYFSVYLQ